MTPPAGGFFLASWLYNAKFFHAYKRSEAMEIVVAEAYGMCFGVRDALALALNDPRPETITVLGELVHNPDVLRRLDTAGLHRVSSTSSRVDTPRVMITAHGAAPSVHAGLRERALEVLDATCPLVTRAHRMLDRLVAQGYFPVVIGKRGHVEVTGLTLDLAECAIVETDADLSQLEGHDCLGVVSQTTQTPELVASMVAAIRGRFPNADVRHYDTTCRPTRERQAAARQLARNCDVVIVVGGRGSNNTRQLVRTCEAIGARAYQVEYAIEVRSEWLQGARRVGLTAGTSTPDEVIRDVHRTLQRIAAHLIPESRSRTHHGVIARPSPATRVRVRHSRAVAIARPEGSHLSPLRSPRPVKSAVKVPAEERASR